MSYKKRIRDLEKQYNQVKQQIKQDRKRYNDADNAAADAIEANDILQSISQELQQQAHKQISLVVSKCLAAVFDEPYEFEIHFERKRNRTQANLVLSRDGVEIGNPMDATGGGVIDVASFAIRISALLLQQPPRRRLVVLDEPFKFLHPPERRPRIVKMLEMLSNDFDIQFIIVTGIDELRCGRVIDLGVRA